MPLERPHVMPGLWLLLVCLACVLSCSADGPGLPPDFEAVGPEISGNGLPRRIRHRPTGIVLRLVDAGRATLGSAASEAERDGDEFEREVQIAEPFYLGETEVTVAQWTPLMGSTQEDFVEDAESPIGGVTWHRASEFVRLLNAQGDGLWCLPTEDQWEYACRAGTTTAYSFGATIDPEVVNYDGRYPYGGVPKGLDRGKPLHVRSLPPNPWGFYEMHGNVWEWCADVYRFDPREPDDGGSSAGVARVIRGGDFSSAAKEVRSAFREGYPPKSDESKYGLRVARRIDL